MLINNEKVESETILYRSQKTNFFYIRYIVNIFIVESLTIVFILYTLNDFLKESLNSNMVIFLYILISLIQLIFVIQIYFLYDKKIILTEKMLYVIENDLFRNTYFIPIQHINAVSFSSVEYLPPRFIDITKLEIIVKNCRVLFYLGENKSKDILIAKNHNNEKNNIQWKRAFNTKYIFVLILIGNPIIVVVILFLIGVRCIKRKNCLTTAST